MLYPLSYEGRESRPYRSAMLVSEAVKRGC